MDNMFDRCLDFTLAQEGGFADDPRDPGGATFKGITLNSLRFFLNDPDVDVSDLRALDASTIRDFYLISFWIPMRCGVLAAGLDLMIFDHGVNAGAGRPVPMLQNILGVEEDGIAGPLTLAAIAARPRLDLIVALRGRQEHYYRGLKAFGTFGDGWLKRLSRRFTLAVKLAGPASPAPAQAAA